MGSLGYCSMFSVLCQTTFSVIISWLILSCKLPPDESELHEVTLIKLLYLYDPEACGRVYFYNHTKSQTFLSSNIVWPVKNNIAARFRKQIQVWLSLHILWSLLGLLYATQGRRPCSFYSALLPFTLTGIAILVMDLVYTAFFLIDLKNTGTEADILEYINTDSNVVTVNKTLHSMQSVYFTPPQVVEEDTSWIALLLAYISCRAVVQWFINFWMVKDNYYDGLDYYRRLSKLTEKNHNHY